MTSAPKTSSPKKLSCDRVVYTSLFGCFQASPFQPISRGWPFGRAMFKGENAGNPVQRSFPGCEYVGPGKISVSSLWASEVRTERHPVVPWFLILCGKPQNERQMFFDLCRIPKMGHHQNDIPNWALTRILVGSRTPMSGNKNDVDAFAFSTHHRSGRTCQHQILPTCNPSTLAAICASVSRTSRRFQLATPPKLT